MKQPPPTPVADHLGLTIFAACTVACMLGLIFVGGLVTSWQAGMSVPDWPLSFGSLNPEGWWGDWPVRLEHGHRLFASFVGLLVTILCAWIWGNGWPLLLALVISASLTPLVKWIELPPIAVMHLSIWSFAAAFAVALLLMSRPRDNARSRTIRTLAFAAFLGVCLQATLGGLRVVLETSGNFSTAMTLRIVHGCVAQAELCLVVAVAVMLTRSWRSADPFAGRGLHTVQKLAWSAFAMVFLQLMLGAAMRHLGAGLAIPTFPNATPEGGMLPDLNPYALLNFFHTRVGVLLVTLATLHLVASIFRLGPGLVHLKRLGGLLFALVFVQIGLGMAVIWHAKPVTLTTFHVLNGAAVLMTTLVIALRANRSLRAGDSPFVNPTTRVLQEVRA